MKTGFLCIAVVLISHTVSLAQPWSSTQQTVVNRIAEFSHATVHADISSQMAFFHPTFLARNFSQFPSNLVNRDGWRNVVETFNTNVTWIAFEMRPLAVSVEGDQAIVFIDYLQHRREVDGRESKISGPLTATMSRSDGQWMFTSMSWTTRVE